MPRKVARSDADIEQLAAKLRSRWVPADGIKPWLRRNVSRFSRMIRNEGWSWEDIGRALTLAGITFGGGVPWTRKSLTVKVAQARAQLRDRAKKAIAVAVPSQLAAEPPPSPIQAVSRPTIKPNPKSDGDQAPTFELASLTLNEFIPPKPSHDSSGTSKPSSTPRSINADEVIRRIRGGRAVTGSED